VETDAIGTKRKVTKTRQGEEWSPKRKKQYERLQEVREHSHSKDDPNPPRHRIAARWRLCLS